MTRSSWERWAALAGLAFVVFYGAAFAMGIEVGNSDREILDYYASSSHRAKELVAFFLISAAALSLVVFANALRGRIARAEGAPPMLAPLAWAGATGCAVLILAGNALSRATAFTAMDKEFTLDPNTRRLFEDAGFLLFVAGALAAILPVVAVSIAVSREADSSRFEQIVSLSAGEGGNRVEFRNAVDWRTQASTLKATFPLTASNPEATYNWDVGTMKRATRPSSASMRSSYVRPALIRTASREPLAATVCNG